MAGRRWCRVNAGRRRSVVALVLTLSLGASADVGGEITLSPRELVNAQPGSKAVAVTSTTRLVAWTRTHWVPPPDTSSALVASRVDASGNLLDPLGIELASGPETQQGIVVSTDGSGFLVGWTVPATQSVVARRIDADGTFPDGTAVTSATGVRLAQGWDGSAYRILVAAGGQLQDIHVASSGAVTSTSAPLALGGLATASVGATSLIVHSDGSKIWGVRLDGAGLPLDAAPGLLVHDPAPDVVLLAAAPVDGGHAVAWSAKGVVLPPGTGGTSGSASQASSAETEPANSGGGPSYFQSVVGAAIVSETGNVVVGPPLGSWQPTWLLAASRGTEAAVLWDNYQVVAARLGANGTLLQPATQLSEPLGLPALAGDASGWTTVAGSQPAAGQQAMYHLSPGLARDGVDVRPFRAVSSQTEITAASSGDGYLVVWRDTQNADLCPAALDEPGDVYAVRLDGCGNVLDAHPLAISTRGVWNARELRVAFGGGLYAVTWVDDMSFVAERRFARVTPDGQVLDPDGVVLGTNSFGGSSLASDGSGFLLISGWPDIQARRFDAAGNVDPAVIQVTSSTDTYWSPEVTFDGTNYVVSLRRQAPEPPAIVVVRVSPSGSVLDAQPVLVSTGSELHNGPMASDGTNTLVTWSTAAAYLQPPTWYGRLVDKSGQPADAKIWDLGSATHQRGNLVFDGNYVWQSLATAEVGPSYVPGAIQLVQPWLRRFATDGTPIDATALAAPELWSGSHQTGLAAGADAVLVAYTRQLGEPDDTHRARARRIDWGGAPPCPADAGTALGPDFSGAIPVVDCDSGVTYDDGGLDGSDGSAGNAGTGGTTGTGGSGGGATGGAGALDAAPDGTAPDAAVGGGGLGGSPTAPVDDGEDFIALGGCGCRAGAGGSRSSGAWTLLGCAVALLVARRTRRRRPA